MENPMLRSLQPLRGVLHLAGWLVALAMTMTAMTGADAQDATLLRVNTFPNAKAVALHSGIANGIFEKRGLKIDLHLTPNSRSQREGLAAGKFDIVHAAVDNALAMIEVAKEDVVIVTGGDSGMNEFFVQPEIKSFADLRIGEWLRLVSHHCGTLRHLSSRAKTRWQESGVFDQIA
jgi:ABC-type nitrate/sulfonate/bicarbonate transport system substrate-binding protein